MSDAIGKVQRIRTTEEIEASGEFQYKVDLPFGMGDPLFVNTESEIMTIICTYGVVRVTDLKYGGPKC